MRSPCPLPVCVEDVPGGAAILRRVIRDAEVRRRRRDGEALEVVAECVGLSRRGVERIVTRRE